MNRRDLIKGAAAGFTLAGGSAHAGLLGGLLPRTVPLTRETHRVIIIGSGFGGGVSALRLAQAGVRSTVLERGKWWPTGPNADTFPRVSNPDERAVWYGMANPYGLYSLAAGVPDVFGLSNLGLPALHAGVLEVLPDPNMLVFCAAGVGGGSLVYQGMTLQPTEAVFNEVLPEALDYRRMDRVFYPRVASMIHPKVAPDSLINTPNYRAPRIWAERARRAGFQVEKVPMPIDWEFALRELRGEMAAAYTNGDGALGVNNGGKFSVDVTYLKQAMDTGNVDVKALHNVTRIARTTDGRWRVFVDRTDVTGKLLEQKIMTTNALILSAGSAGTIRLLQRAQYWHDIQDLPDGVGQKWGTNGDRIMFWNSPTDDFGAEQGGPVIFGSKEWERPEIANTVIQASIPPVGVDTHTTSVVGFGVSPTRGRWQYNPLTNDSHLSWPREGDLGLHTRILERLHAIAGKDSVIIDSHIAAPMTWHPLGGANMGEVCDLDGRVYGQRGLYVLDGALIPGSTAACNPSMTIAAVAERAMSNIVARDIGTLI